MTAGSPGRIIIEFALPVFLGNVFQEFYSMVDTIIVGKFVGTNALAAVGSTGMINFLVFGFVWGMTAGFAVPVGQRFGAGDMKSLRQCVGTSVYTAMLLSAVLTFVSCLSMRSLMVLLHTPQDIFKDAYSYIMIVCGGLAATVLYNMTSYTLRAIGNSRTPLVFLILSAMLNILLDLLFVITFRMGVAGAAYATVISQAISGFACLFYIIRRVPLLRLSRDDLKFRRDLAVRQLYIGLPMALQFSITAIGALMVQAALNMLGTLYVAAYTAAGKIESLVTQMFGAQGATMAAYCAQNTGARKTDRIRQGIHASDIQSFLYAAAVGVLMITLGGHMTGLFISDRLEEVVPLVNTYLLCSAPFYIPLAIIFIYRNAMQGMGCVFVPMAGGVVELIARAVMSVVAANLHSYVGVCLAGSVAWAAAAAWLLCGYAWTMKRKKKSFSI
ncbi:MAG: MATE family efflux transporter [Lachnospiraceae bacterium]|nr:MATE family efflux transporter [Lachnospiraceae bacterium]